MSVLLINNFMDEIPNAKIKLGRQYDKIRFVNCKGNLAENIVTISEISPYCIVAFEVKCKDR